MESGPSRVSAPLEGLRFQGPEGTFTASWKMTIQAPRQTSRLHEGRCMQRKRWGREGGAHREWCSVGETRRRGTVVGVCLVYRSGIRRRDCVNPQDATSRSQRDLLCLFVCFQPSGKGGNVRDDHRHAACMCMTRQAQQHVAKTDKSAA